jgi:hypothetical protein
LDSHSQTRNAITLASAPYVLLYELKFAAYTAKSPDAASHSSTARMLPGLIQRRPPSRAFGDAQYSSENSRLTSSTRTGHLAISHTLTAVDSIPSAAPAVSAT